MKNWRTPSFLIVLLFTWSTSCLAGEGFWDMLRSKLENITPQKKTATTTAVGGVRGAKNQSTESLYWKGEEREVKIDEEEYASFNAAFASASAGDKAQATVKFDEFLKLYPESPLRDDALLALQTLQEKPTPAAATPTAATPPAAAE